MPFKCIKKENNLIMLLTCCNPILFTFPEDPGFHLSSSKGIQNFLHAYSPPCLYPTPFNIVFSLDVRFFSSSSAPLMCLMKDFFFLVLCLHFSFLQCPANSYGVFFFCFICFQFLLRVCSLLSRFSLTYLSIMCYNSFRNH